MSFETDIHSVSVRSQITRLKTKEDLQLTLLAPLKSTLSAISTNLIHNFHYNSRSTASPATITQPNANRSRVFQCDDVLLKSKTQKGPFLTKLSFQLNDQYAIVSHLEGDNYILSYTTQAFGKEASSTGIMFTASSIKEEEIPKSWTSALSKEPMNTIKLSMAPPIQSSPARSIANEKSPIKDHSQKESTDPFDYFMHKYFDTLYQLTTPLTFFAKSTFSRLRTLSAQTTPEVSYSSILEQFLINFEQFDSRHLISNNGILNSIPLFEMEAIYRDSFISKSLNLVDFDVHSLNYSETNKSLMNTLNQFKIREIQLQLIVLLELISVKELDNPKNFKKLAKQESKRKKQLVKKPLIGRKNKKKPVLNDGASLQPSASTSDLDFTELFDTFVDKLCIWDILNPSTSLISGSSTSISSSRQNSPRKFISYVIIPFFDKKCPYSVKHIIKKVKGPSFKAKAPTSKSDPRRQRSSSVTSTGSSESSSREISRPPITRTSSKLGDLDEFRLNRSNSDLQILKRNSSFNANTLSKREIDFSMPIKATSSKSLKRSNSSIFSRVGKKLETSKSMKYSISSSSQRLQSESFSQVSETPMKKQKVINVLETPNDSVHSETQVVSSVERPLSTHVEIPPNGSIMSSAVKSDAIINSPTLKQGLLSPLNMRSSTKRRPGEPFEFRSPEERMFGGSPSAKKVRRKLFAPKPKELND